MEQFFFITYSITFLIFLLSIFYINDRKVFVINLLSIVSIWFFIFSFFGYFLLFYKIDNVRVSVGMGITENIIILKCLLFSIITISTVYLIFLIAKKNFIHTSFVNKKYMPHSKISKYFFYFIIFFILFSFIFYLFQLDQVPLHELFSQNSSINKLASLRENAGNSFNNYFIYRFLIRDVLLILVLIFFSQYLLEKKRKYFFMFIFLFFCLAYSNLVALEKGPLLRSLLAIFFVYYLSMRKQEIKINSNFILFGIFILFLIIVGFYLTTEEKNISILLGKTFSRIFTGNLSGTYFYYDYFTNISDFLLGKTFPNPKNILEFESFDLTRQILAYASEYDQKLSNGTYPTTFWAEMFINFNILGVIFGSIFVGLYIALFEKFFSLLNFSSINISIYVWVIFHFTEFAITSFSNFLIDIPLFLMILFLLVINIFDDKFFLKSIKQQIFE